MAQPRPPTDEVTAPVELSSIFGLPAHPLIVHAVVVLVPLVALGALAIAASPRLRARYGTLVAVGAVLDVVLVPLATSSGEQLQESVKETALVQQHTEMGEQLLPLVLAMAVAVVFLVVRPHLIARRGEGTATPRWGAQWVATAMVVVALLGAVGSLVQVARIGHSGAKAAWSNVTVGTDEARAR